MGMYTSLIGAVKIKEEFRELVFHFANYMEGELEKDKKKYPFVRDYFSTTGAKSIPNNNQLDGDGFYYIDENFFKNRLEGDIWYFSSNLKNYIDTATGLSPIDSFFQNILINIASDILILETQYEENSYIRQYNFSGIPHKKIENINIISLEPEEPPRYWLGYGEELVLDNEEIDVFAEFKMKNELKTGGRV